MLVKGAGRQQFVVLRCSGVGPVQSEATSRSPQYSTVLFILSILFLFLARTGPGGTMRRQDFSLAGFVYPDVM